MDFGWHNPIAVLKTPASTTVRRLSSFENKWIALQNPDQVVQAAACSIISVCDQNNTIMAAAIDMARSSTATMASIGDDIVVCSQPNDLFISVPQFLGKTICSI